MSAEPTGYLLQARERGFVDVTALVTHAPVDFDARDLNVAASVTVAFRGVEHTVYIVPCPDGMPACWYQRGWGRYVYQGVRHKSLTSIARLIVGPSDARVSGNRFFGLRRRRRNL